MKSTGPTSPSNPPFLSGNRRAARGASVGCVSAQGSRTWQVRWISSLGLSSPSYPFSFPKIRARFPSDPSARILPARKRDVPSGRYFFPVLASRHARRPPQPPWRRPERLTRKADAIQPHSVGVSSKHQLVNLYIARLTRMVC